MDLENYTQSFHKTLCSPDQRRLAEAMWKKWDRLNGPCSRSETVAKVGILQSNLVLNLRWNREEFHDYSQGTVNRRTWSCKYPSRNQRQDGMEKLFECNHKIPVVVGRLHHSIHQSTVRSRAQHSFQQQSPQNKLWQDCCTFRNTSSLAEKTKLRCNHTHESMWT